LKEVTIEISASVVAWYGAIVATLAVIISGWIAWRDRARIVVTGSAGMKIHPGDPNKRYILITVANHGPVLQSKAYPLQTFTPIRVLPLEFG